jgi:phosphate transport system substrate-binding protein
MLPEWKKFRQLQGVRVKLKLFAVALLAMVATAASAQDLVGAGSTFGYPIYSKWFSEYGATHPGVKINYQSIGSGGGIRQVSIGTVDFGASDGPMSDQELAASKVKLIHIPTVLGAVVPIYNIPGVSADLRFAPDVLADIYLGKITHWNDARIAKDNPGVNLPNRQIFVVHRSDGSGTTYIFADFLSKSSKEWAEKVGKNTSLSWPVGIGGKGSEGVSGLVRQTPGAIGYVELIYALQNKMSYGYVRNPAGVWLKGSIAGVTAAAAGVKKMPSDFRVSITDAPGKDAYPISSFTWLLIPIQSKTPEKGKVIRDFLYWMLAKGEAEAGALYYAPLPASVAAKVKATIPQIH